MSGIYINKNIGCITKRRGRHLWQHGTDNLPMGQKSRTTFILSEALTALDT